MELRCPHCDNIIRIKQEYPYHSGFSNQGFLYCEACPSILEFHTYNSYYMKLFGEIDHKHPWSLSNEEKKNVEEHLNPCCCGGHFRFDAYPRCPHCNENIVSLLPDKIHYLEIGDVIDADKNPSVWLNQSEID